MSWNIEGFSRNFQSLRHYTEVYQPVLIFLSEPMLINADLPPLLQPFIGKYDSFLNSEDCHDPSLALESTKAHGGTMIMWHISLTPFVTILPSKSPGFQTILLKLPSAIPSLHTALYLPTAGKEHEFTSMLVELEAHIEELRSTFPSAPHFMRGDANSNPNNISRFNLFTHFYTSLLFSRIPLQHPTYHHFMGNGCFDSEIDVLLVYGNDVSESVTNIVCKLDSPLVDSHHDIILSVCSIPRTLPSHSQEYLVNAPRISNTRTKIIWSEEGIAAYEQAVGTGLADLSERWGNPSSRSSLSVLLSSTYQCLSFAASSTNKSVNLAETKRKNALVPSNIRRSEKLVLKARRTLDHLLSANSNPDDIDAARTSLRGAKANLRQQTRAELSQMRIRGILSSPLSSLGIPLLLTRQSSLPSKPHPPRFII